MLNGVSKLAILLVHTTALAPRMGKERLDNVAPTVYANLKPRERERSEHDYDESVTDPVDAREVFDYIRDINDPEHPYTLEQLNVVQVRLGIIRCVELALDCAG